MNLEVLYSRSIMEAPSKRAWGTAFTQTGEPLHVVALGDCVIDCSTACWVHSFTQQDACRGDGLSPRQVVLHIVIYKVFSGYYRLGLGDGFYFTHFMGRLKEAVMVKLTGRGRI